MAPFKQKRWSGFQMKSPMKQFPTGENEWMKKHRVSSPLLPKEEPQAQFIDKDSNLESEASMMVQKIGYQTICPACPGYNEALAKKESLAKEGDTGEMITTGEKVDPENPKFKTDDEGHQTMLTWSWETDPITGERKKVPNYQRF